MGCAGQTSPIHGGSTSQRTGLKGSVANFLVPDTTAQGHGLSGVHDLTGLFWQQKREQHNIRLVVIMKCLIGVHWWNSDVMDSIPLPRRRVLGLYRTLGLFCVGSLQVLWFLLTVQIHAF